MRTLCDSGYSDDDSDIPLHQPAVNQEPATQVAAAGSNVRNPPVPRTYSSIKAGVASGDRLFLNTQGKVYTHQGIKRADSWRQWCCIQQQQYEENRDQHRQERWPEGKAAAAEQDEDDSDGNSAQSLTTTEPHDAEDDDADDEQSGDEASGEEESGDEEGDDGDKGVKAEAEAAAEDDAEAWDESAGGWRCWCCACAAIACSALLASLAVILWLLCVNAARTLRTL